MENNSRSITIHVPGRQITQKYLKNHLTKNAQQNLNLNLNDYVEVPRSLVLYDVTKNVMLIEGRKSNVQENTQVKSAVKKIPFDIQYTVSPSFGTPPPYLIKNYEKYTRLN